MVVSMQLGSNWNIATEQGIVIYRKTYGTFEANRIDEEGYLMKFPQLVLPQFCQTPITVTVNQEGSF